MLASLSFGYTKLLLSQVGKLKEMFSIYDTEQVVVSFNKDISEIQNLSSRLKLLDNICDRYIYVSQILFPVLESLIESNTKSYVYFNRFSISNEKEKSSEVFLSGVALDYATLIRQLRNFKSDTYKDIISDFKLNSISVDLSGSIIFNVSFSANISGDKRKTYQNISSFESSDTNLKFNTNPGPLFKITPVATNTVPVEVQKIYDQLIESATTTTESGDSNTNTNTNVNSSSADSVFEDDVRD